MAELADALGSGPSVRKDIGVRIPASAHFISKILNRLIYRKLGNIVKPEKPFHIANCQYDSYPVLHEHLKVSYWQFA